MSTRRARRIVTRDLVCFLLGLAMIAWQAFGVSRAEFNWITMVIGVGLTQAPGAMAVVSLIRTGGLSSPPAVESPSPPPPSSSSSTSASEGEVPA